MATMMEQRLSTSSPKLEEFRTPVKTPPEQNESSTSPTVSRYGRSHKPKMQDDYVSTDKKVSAYLKLSPGSQMQYFSCHKEPKKRGSPKKSEVPEGTPRRGRPPKIHLKDGKREDPLKIVAKAEPQDPNLPVDGCEWMVGDLAWARVGGHPFWPCIIALDPLQKIFTKLVRKGRTTVSQRWVHVQFFGDNGRRSWLNTTSVMAYNGRDAFIQLGDTILAGMRKKEPKQTAAFVIKPAVMQVWEKAVQEAEDLINAKREERTAFFDIYFPPPPVPTRDELIEKVLEETTTPPKKRGRKRKLDPSSADQEPKKKQIKLELTPVSEPVDPLLTSTPRTIADRKKRQALLIQLARSNQSATPTTPETPAVTVTTPPIPESPPPPPVVKQPVIALKRSAVTESTPPMEKKKPKKKSTKKKLTADFQTFCSKQFDRVADDHPELSEKDINKYLQKMWNEMDDTQKARYKSRFTGQEVESTEETSEDASSGSAEDGEEEIASSKSSSPAPLALATQKPAAAKRNNCKYLFSGAKAEKVLYS